MYRFFAAPLSLYSAKVRGFLRWKNIPYREEMSSREIYKTEILPRIGYGMIPVMAAPDNETLQDSTDIIEIIDAAEPGPSVIPNTPRQKLAALILELFGDEYLLIAAMHYRWNYNEDFAYGEFGKAVAPEKSGEEQYAIGKKSGSVFRGHLPPLGITPKTHPAIESVYWEFMEAFNTHLKTHTYLFGSRPSIGDYGLLGPLYAHNLRDPKSGKMMRERAPHVANWCLNTHAPQEALSGEFDAGDHISSSVITMLEIFAREQLPILLDTAKHLSQWAKTHDASDKLPLKLGEHNYTTRPKDDEPVTETRTVRSYSLWMVGRVLDHIEAQTGVDKQACLDLLEQVGANDIMNIAQSPRLIRENFRVKIKA